MLYYMIYFIYNILKGKKHYEKGVKNDFSGSYSRVNASRTVRGSGGGNNDNS